MDSSGSSRVLALGECGAAAEHLRKNGYEVLKAMGLSRALGLARDLLPEIVLVGTGTDPKAAEELIGQIAGDPVTRLLPVLLLITQSEPDLVRRGLQAGASDVFAADVEEGELLARVTAALRAKRGYEELIAEKQRSTLLELAGAVAHRMNQPLTSMSVIVETLIAAQGRGDLSPDRLVARLHELQRLVERMALIVKQVASIVEYRTTDYVGDVKIIDLESSQDPRR